MNSPHFTRRTFLRGSALLAGAALAAPQMAMAAEAGAGRKLRIGVVGGRFGAGFFFHEHPDCIVEAVSDLVPERCARLAKTYRCTKTYESLEQMLRDPKVEAVFIATGAPDHAKHVLATMEAGKHVLSAVPLAMTLEDCAAIKAKVKATGLTYMMAETSHWQQATISARKYYKEGKFGTIYCTESSYHHAGLETLWFEDGKATWRHGLPPMLYPTHCTSHLVSVTGERLTEVSCIGWGDDDPILKNNPYHNPFWNESAQFKTDRGHIMKVDIWWRGAHRGCERAQYYGDKMSFFFPHPNGVGAVIVRSGKQLEKDNGGFDRQLAGFENVVIPEWWKTDLLPEPLRHKSGHEGSHTFITHEFVDAVVKGRRPAVSIDEALAYTVPGIVAHQSALKGGERMRIPAV